MDGIVNAITGETSVTINNHRFEELVRDSERISILRKFCKENKYISKEELAILLGVEEEGEADEV